MLLKTLLPRYYQDRYNKIIQPPFALDDPKFCLTSARDWNNHPIQNYNYSFNSWAFRGNDYEQYKSTPVNICLGDSFTLNLGGPQDHSWPSQLAENFDIPTLNFGVDGAGNDIIQILYHELNELFDVQNTFVVYSFFHRRYDSKSKDLIQISKTDSENFSFFEKNKIDNAFFTFLPAWCWSPSELKYIEENYLNEFIFSRINQLIDRDFLEKNRSFLTNRTLYEVVAGSTWPSYDDFVDNAILEKSIHFEIFYDIFEKILDIKNRDGYHLNYAGNKMVCDYFLSQVNRTP